MRPATTQQLSSDDDDQSAPFARCLFCIKDGLELSEQHLRPSELIFQKWNNKEEYSRYLRIISQQEGRLASLYVYLTTYTHLLGR